MSSLLTPAQQAQTNTPAPTSAPTSRSSAPPPSSGGGSPTRPQGRFIGDLIGGVGGIIGGIIGAEGNKDAAEASKPPTPEEFWESIKDVQKDQMSDSHYSDFASFQSQLDAKLQREQLNTMFPELNPWELAGVPTSSPTSAAVAPSVEIGKTATQGQVQGAITQANNQTTLQMGMLSAAKDMAIARLNSQTSIENNKSSVEAQNKMVDPQIAKIKSDIETASSQRNVNSSQIGQMAQNIVESKARTEGIALTSLQTAEQTRYVAQQIEQSRATVRNLDATGYKATVDAALGESNIRTSELTQDKLQSETKLTDAKTRTEQYGRGHIMSDVMSMSNAAMSGIDDATDRISSWLDTKLTEIKASRNGINSRANVPQPNAKRH